MVFKFAGGPIVWGSKKQETVALSTTEAEYVAASEAAKNVIWLTRLFAELSDNLPCPVLQVDNVSAIRLAKNPEFHKRTKHVDIRHHFIRDLIEKETLAVDYVKSEDQLADIFTKPLVKAVFVRIRNLLGLCSPY